jgi:Zn-finger nucleic acid-binding protein
MPLVPRHIHDLVLDECSQCRGLFLDTIGKKLLAEQDAARAEALFAAVATDAHESPADVDITNVAACPVCGVAMHRKLSDTGAGIGIDICKAHGTFYDGGELQRLLAYTHRQAQQQAVLDDEQQKYAERLASPDGISSETAIVATLFGVAAIGVLGGGTAALLFAEMMLVGALRETDPKDG